METAIAARPMVYKEARECVDNINANMNDVRHLVYDLYTREGWSALGHKTWRECVTGEKQEEVMDNTKAVEAKMDQYLKQQAAQQYASQQYCGTTLTLKSPPTPDEEPNKKLLLLEEDEL